MSPALERGLYLGAIVLLSLLVARAGATQTALEKELPYPVESLYGLLASGGGRVQLIDTRPLEVEDEDDDIGGYEYSHVPGAIPFPGCRLEDTPPEAAAQIQAGVDTIIISREGSRATFERCAPLFPRVRNLAGGMSAWLEADLPEDEGEYVPPSMGGGGGCL